MKHFYLGTVIVTVAAIAGTTMALGLFMYVLAWQAPARVAYVTESEPATLPPTVEEEPCVPVRSDSTIPKVPGALRLQYDDAVYTVRQPEKDVMEYYLPTLAEDCWTLQSLAPHEAVWEREGATFALAVAERGLGEKTVVSYRLNEGKVFGYKIAVEGTEPQPTQESTTQSPPPPPHDGSGQPGYPPQGDQQMPQHVQPGTHMQPPPFDPRNQPMQGKEACGAGQFHCNGACVPQGTACNGYPYFQPGKRMEGEMTGRDPKGQPMPRRPMHGNMRGGPGMDTRRVGQGGDMKNGEENMGGPEMKGEGDMNDEQQQQMDEQRFNMMKRGLQQFANGVKQMEKMIKRTEPKLAKNGVSVPPELKAALAKAPELVEKIKQATSADELEDLMDEVQDVGDTMQEWGPKFGELMRLSEMISRAGQDVKMLDKAVKRLGTAAKKNTVIADAVTQLQSQVTTMKTTLEEVKALAKTDPEAALETLEDGFYGNMEEFWNSVAEVDMVANVSKGLGQAKSEIAKAERRVKALEKSKKVDAETIASLRELLESIKASAKNMEGIAKKTPIDFEEVKSGAEELWQLVEEFENKMADLGEGNYEPKVQRGENVQFELPEGFGSGPRNSQQSGFGAEDGSNSFGGF